MMTLAEFLRAAHGRPFRWGDCDCALWVCERIAQVRGVDPGAIYRGTYATARGCRRVLRRNGGLLELATCRFAAAGLDQIAAAAATAGDAVCVAAPFGATLGLVVAPGAVPRVAMKTERGVLVSALHPILRAWRI